MKKVLFIDRDGTLIKEAPPTYQIDSFSKLEFYPGVFTWMRRIARELGYELVMITNQDGLGTEAFPEKDFQSVHDFVMTAFSNEDIHFSEVLIDRTYPKDNADTRKPGTGLLKNYINSEDYDIASSYVIGDRITDVQLAKNLCCKAIWINNDSLLGAGESNDSPEALMKTVALETKSWEDIFNYLRRVDRTVHHTRKTNETDIRISLDLDGSGRSQITTGLQFFDHMLDQLSRHSGVDIILEAKGDLHIDEHHTIEDTAIALGEAFFLALGDKKGITRYGYLLPMDDCLARVAIDFGGRPWLVWDVKFEREKIGDVPTEMFFHFFKSFSDAAKCNLNIQAEGTNEHHKIESVFKAVAKSIGTAVKRNPDDNLLPSTKGML